MQGRVDKQGEFTFVTDICIHCVLMNSVQRHCMSEHVVLLKLAILSVTVSCQNGCVDDIL
jgi:hypothetical protein